MKKIIRYIICEGKKAKTEKNFLQSYQKDFDFLKKINSNNKELITFLSKRNNFINFEIDNIAYKKLERILDAMPEQSYLLVYIDNDDYKPIDFVKKIAQKWNLSDEFSQKNDSMLVYPSYGKAFEELISYFFEKSTKIYKSSKDLKKLKELLGEDFKTDKQIYKKTIKKGKQKIFLNNMKNHSDKKIFNLLLLKI